MFEKNNPYELLMDAVDMINEHTEMFDALGTEMNKQEQLLAELIKQNQLFLRQIKLINQHMRSINARLQNLENNKDTE